MDISESKIFAEYLRASGRDPIAFLSLFHYMRRLLLDPDPFLGWFDGRIARCSNPEEADPPFAPVPDLDRDFEAGAGGTLLRAAAPIVEARMLRFDCGEGPRAKLHLRPHGHAAAVPFAADRDLLAAAAVTVGAFGYLVRFGAAEASAEETSVAAAFVGLYADLVEARGLWPTVLGWSEALQSKFRREWIGPSLRRDAETERRGTVSLSFPDGEDV